jgi:hypothetical protein
MDQVEAAEKGMEMKAEGLGGVGTAVAQLLRRGQRQR